jgi:4-carboxymuconolactone decarboxylase
MRTAIVPRVNALGFRATTTDGRFIGPFNPALRGPALAGEFLRLQATEARGTSLSERVRQVVILAIARRCGIPDEAVRDMAGAPCPTPSATRRRSPRRHDLRRGPEKFGERGIADMILLAGTYHTVCGLLNAFDVPVPEA